VVVKDYNAQSLSKAIFSGEGLFVYNMSGNGLSSVDHGYGRDHHCDQIQHKEVCHRLKQLGPHALNGCGTSFHV
jgi:hypothetical protein